MELFGESWKVYSFDFFGVHGVSCLLLGNTQQEIGEGYYHDKNNDNTQRL